MKLKLTILAAAMSLASTAFAGETQQTFNAADMQQLFGQKSKPAQLATLSQKEMKETEGANYPDWYDWNAILQPPAYWENGLPKWNVYNESRQSMMEDMPKSMWPASWRNPPASGYYTKVNGSLVYVPPRSSIAVQSMNTWNGQQTGGQLGISLGSTGAQLGIAGQIRTIR
ncbi:MAG: hypothetical protein FWH56_05965 [Betaproteobacteria bacterium]|nr:hypothetical protein [Betaproteobacteria bacterium]